MNKARAVLIDKTLQNLKRAVVYSYCEDITAELGAIERLSDEQRQKYFTISKIAFEEGIDSFLEALKASNLALQFSS